MIAILAPAVFFWFILRDPKPVKFVPVRHKIWADDGSPINPTTIGA